MSKPGTVSPLAEYSRCLEARRMAVARQEKTEVRIAVLRLSAFFAAGILAWLAFGAGEISPWWLAIPASFFLCLVVLHERVRRTRRSLVRAVAFFERGIARLENRWAGTGATGDRFLDKSHPYAEDLDLFGKGSLFELICRARTRAGENTLADWLTGAAAPEVIRGRQAAVEELRGRLDLRENLAVAGDEVPAGVNPDALAAWGQAPPLLTSRVLRIAAAALASATTLSLVWWLARDSGREVFFLLVLSEALFALSLRRSIRSVIMAVEKPGQDLALLSRVLLLLEQQKFNAPRLLELRRMLDIRGLPSSRRIARLDRLIVMREQLFAPIAALFLWNIQMAFAIEAWRKESGTHVAGWLSVVGEMEALASLGGHAFEHPDDPFPELVAEGPHFEALDLGHPLIPESVCVRNDVRLCSDLRVLVVSGSNMSGKSTFLRTVGVNAVLAMAGATVRARYLSLSPLSVGASILRRDSLQEGTSRFYAEITRLRRLVDLTTGSAPLIFLLDELLHGTNSHDRSIGAEAVIRDLVRRGAIGLLTTHDLALAHIADALAPQAENVHFEDSIVDGRMVFDYRLHPGVVRKSNALELMRSVGLQI